ncbi:unnamed protein product [Closterium sp. Naga37s-1]|nr:unnamed protein product [Closterium sp. Naga37s-1]
MGNSGGSESSSGDDTALGFTGTGSQPQATRPLENRSKQYQDDPASQQSSPLASPASSATSSAPSPFASPSGAEAEGAERKVLERAVVEMALLQEVSRGGIEGSTLEEEWGELRQAEWLKAVAPQPAVVEKEPWWMLFGPAASAAGTVFGMAGLGFAAKTAAAAPVAVAVVPQMDALWRSFGGASLVALYWRTLVFGKTFRSIEWDLEAYDAPNGNMKSITIRVPSLNAVRTKIALANGLAGASEVEQLALWIPNSGDFVEPLRLAKDLALIPDFGFVIWSRTPASLHCLPSRAAKTMPSPTAAAGSAGQEGSLYTETETNTAAAEKTETGAAANESEALVKHPLEHRWTLWFDNPQQRGKSGGSWGSSLRVVFTFGTVEDFWCLYNNIVQPSKLMNKADMHLFKEGIQPKWEDPKCEKGGSWTIPCSRSKEYLDNMWLHLMLAMIGEQIDEGNDICGAVVSIRPNKDRVALWTKSAASESIQSPSSSDSGSSRSRSSASPSRSDSASSRSRSPPPKKGARPTTESSKKKRSPSPNDRKRSTTPETTMLYVGCLTRNVNQDHLREIFGLYGELSKVEIAMDRVVNLPKGYGYVEFKKRADAEKARLHMDGAQIDGSVVSAQFVLAPKPAERQGQGGQGGPGGQGGQGGRGGAGEGGRAGRQGGVAAAEVPRESRRRKGKVTVPAPRGKEALALAVLCPLHLLLPVVVLRPSLSASPRPAAPPLAGSAVPLLAALEALPDAAPPSPSAAAGTSPTLPTTLPTTRPTLPTTLPTLPTPTLRTLRSPRPNFPHLLCPQSSCHLFPSHPVAPPSPPLLPCAAALSSSPLAPCSSLQPRPYAPPLPLPLSHPLALPALSTPAPTPTTARPQVSSHPTPSTLVRTTFCSPTSFLFPTRCFLCSCHPIPHFPFALACSFVFSPPSFP